MSNTIFFIGGCFIVAILTVWGMFFIDKWVRVIVKLAITPWQNVKTYHPNTKDDFEGVYIWQEKKGFFWRNVYVGQSVKVHRRFKQHISGKGNPDIYRVYCKDPAKLRYKAISMQSVHYHNLDALERRLIHRYNTYRHGYNKTNGNGHVNY